MLTSEEQYRYNRHLILDSIGESGQLKLKSAKVLVIGAGGLGCPALLYLAAAGVGKIGIVDEDKVDISNLQRQVLYCTNDVGREKASTAACRLESLNPNSEYSVYNDKLTTLNALQIISTYDIVIDGTDNFETRYLINDACVLLNKVLVYGSVYKMEGQVAVFNVPSQSGKRSATYRCLFPNPVSGDLNLDCTNVGVVGVLPGVIGVLQATEAIKIICNLGTSLANRLLMVDLSGMNFSNWNFKRNEELWFGFPQSESAFTKMNYNLFCKHEKNIQQLGADELKVLFTEQKNIQIVDVRSEHEKYSGVIPGALEIPFNQLKMRVEEIDSNLKTIVVCAAGLRSELSIKYLENYMDGKLLFNLQGGMSQFSFEKIILNHD